MKTVIIGMGPMGLRHAQSVLQVKGLELAGVADTRPEALEYPQLPASARKYRTTDELLAVERPEMAIVATNAPSHSALVHACLEAGVSRILCEKPLAASLAQAGGMMDAARDCHATLAVNHGRRHVAAYRWLAERIQSGEWGELRSMRFMCPGIGLGCLATHFVDLMRFLSGRDWTAVSGWVDPERGPNPRGGQFHDPGGLIVAEDAQGARYVHEQIEDGAGPMSGVIDLTGGRVIIDERDRCVEVIRRDLSVKPGPGRPPAFETLALPPEAALALDIVAMGTAILRELAQGSAPTCEAVHGYRSLEAVVAAHASHEAGHAPVALPLERPDILSREFPIT